MIVAGGSFKFCRTTGGYLLAPVKKGSDIFDYPFVEQIKGQTLLKRYLVLITIIKINISLGTPCD